MNTREPRRIPILSINSLDEASAGSLKMTFIIINPVIAAATSVRMIIAMNATPAQNPSFTGPYSIFSIYIIHNLIIYTRTSINRIAANTFNPTSHVFMWTPISFSIVGSGVGVVLGVGVYPANE